MTIELYYQEALKQWVYSFRTVKTVITLNPIDKLSGSNELEKKHWHIFNTAIINIVIKSLFTGFQDKKWSWHLHF